MIRLLLLSIPIILIGCAPQKKLMQEASTLEKGGLREEAFQKYSEIYQGWNSAEARVGMKRSAQEILNFKLSEARMSCMSGNYETALKKYEESFAYEQRFHELELNSGSMANDAYNECRSEYFQSLYEQAEDMVLNEEFEGAQKLINKLYSIDRTNKQVQYLETMCEILPNYNAGKQAFELGMYRDAHIYLTEVTRLDAAFRDSKELKEECLKLAGYTLAFVPIYNSKVNDVVESTLGAAVKDNILSLEDPFVHLVERENLNHLLSEQKQSMEGIFDENKAIQAGKLMGARFLITGEVISFESSLGRLQENERKGFLGSTVAAKHVRYREYSRNRVMSASFRYQIVDALTGRIYASETIPFYASEKAEWAEFTGDPDMLWPGEWKYQLIASQEDYIDRDKKQALLEKFKALQEPRSELELQLELCDFVGNKVSGAIGKFRPELNK